MGFEFNDRQKRQEFLNELIKSPKHVKPLAIKLAVNDCLKALPSHYMEGSAEEVVFSNVSFCSDFSLTAIGNNKLIIIDNCVFHASVTVNCLSNTKVIIRNCRFRKEPNIKSRQQEMIGFYGPNIKPKALSPLTPDTSFSSVISLQDTIILN